MKKLLGNKNGEKTYSFKISVNQKAVEEKIISKVIKF